MNCLWICTGVAYDGYLTNCAIYLDSNGNNQMDESESSVLSSNGYFSLPAPSINLEGYIIRMTPAETEVFPDKFVTPGSDTCHDIATLLPERLPLAARPPNTCQKDSIIALSPISTLMTLPGVSAERVEAAFSIPRNANIGSRDILRVRTYHLRLHIQIYAIVSYHLLDYYAGSIGWKLDLSEYHEKGDSSKEHCCTSS